MKAIVVITMLALALLPSSTCGQTPKETALQLAGHPPQSPDYYFSVKQRVGDGGVRDIQRELSKFAYEEAGLPFGTTFSGCRFPDWFSQQSSGFELARASANTKAWQDNLTLIKLVGSRRDALHERVRHGEQVDPAYAGAAAAFRRATTEADGRKAELARRVGEDQLERVDGSVAQSHSLWAADVTPALDAYYREALAGGMCRTDRANTTWLKADLAAHGWPKVSVLGPQADNDVWLLVQHADHDLVFQKSVLVLLEGLLPTKDTQPQSYAYLYDRVAIAEKRAQRYGTQGRCIGPAKWEPYASENPEGLDKRRAAVGLNSEVEYTRMFTFCTAELAAMSGG